MRSAALFAALGLLSLASPVRAEVTFSDFSKICAATGVKAAEAVAAASRAGWLVLPRDVLAKVSDGEVKPTDGRLWSDADGMSVLYVGESSPAKAEEGRVDMCMMTINGAERDFFAKAAQFAAVAADKGKRASEVDYSYIDRAGAHLPLPTDPAEADAALHAGEARLLSLKDGRDGLTVLLMAFTK